jgi:hypothetical protein
MPVEGRVSRGSGAIVEQPNKVSSVVDSRHRGQLIDEVAFRSHTESGHWEREQRVAHSDAKLTGQVAGRDSHAIHFSGTRITRLQRHERTVLTGTGTGINNQPVGCGRLTDG